MASHTGGTKVSGGYYWSARGWRVEVVAQEGGKLPGPSTTRYLKVPFPLLFVVVPVMGLLFIVTMPAIGFVLLAYAMARRLAAALGRGATELASTVQPGLVAGEAHLTGKPGEDGKDGGGAPSRIEQLEKEIAKRRDG
jgi:hypothetical protein